MSIDERDKPVPRFECADCGAYWPNENEKMPEIMKDYVPRAKFLNQGSNPSLPAMLEGKKGPKKQPLDMHYFHIPCMDPNDFTKGRMVNISHVSSPKQRRYQIEREKRLAKIAKEKGIIAI